MREILFKAKRKDNGEWLEGGCCQSTDGRTFLVGVTKRALIDGLEVIPETICQYTGLTDKNGKKIWENDVCSVLLIGEDDIQTENCIVRYGRRAENFKIEMGFNLEWTKTDYLRCDICFWTENREVEVIGNIFDNPELLEGGAE